AGILVLALFLIAAARPAAAFERASDPGRFDYLVPLSRKQAFTVQEMYKSETVAEIVQHLSRLAMKQPDNPRAWEVLCQWTYLWWRITPDKDTKLRIVAAGARAAERLEALRPGSDEGLVWRG